MNIDRKQMKLDARIAMGEQRRPSIYLLTLAMLVVLWLLNGLSTKLAFPWLSVRDIILGADSEELAEYILHNWMRPRLGARILSFLLPWISLVFSLGYTSVCLLVSRRMAAGFGNLLDAFAFFFKVIWLNIVTGFFVFLWSLLLIIPGIVAGYRYCMAPYVLLDNPDKSVMDCIRESKQMTMGHKGELFVMNLSFLGWALLSVIPFVSLFTMPYMEITMANYYNALSGYQPQANPALDAPRDDSGDGSWWN